jgi:hypothetical protein
VLIRVPDAHNLVWIFSYTLVEICNFGGRYGVFLLLRHSEALGSADQYGQTFDALQQLGLVSVIEVVNVDAVLAVDYTFAESLHDGCQLQYGLTSGDRNSITDLNNMMDRKLSKR